MNISLVKSFCVIGLTVGIFMTPLVPPAWSQPVTPPSQDSPTTDAQRAAIVTKRQQLEAGFVVEDAVCYKRFAVNSCLNEVNVRRRQAMADLRRQDVLLNDQERKRRGTDQLLRIEEKQSEARQEASSQNRAKVLSEYQSRLATNEQRTLEKKPEADVLSEAERATKNRIESSQAKEQARLDMKAKAPQETEKFSERQRKAAERRAQHEKQLLEKDPSQAKPLPLPTTP